MREKETMQIIRWQLALASCSSNARFARIPALGGGVA